MDEPAFPGCSVPARLIGVIEGEQVDGKKRIRNDRLVAVEALMIIVLIVLILIFGFGGYRLGPGIGYYGGGGVSLILLIVLILLLLRVI